MAEDKGLRARRATALARNELRNKPDAFFFKLQDRVPEKGRLCIVRAHDGDGDYTIPFGVEYREGRWVNPKHDKVIEVRIIGWRYE